MPKYRFVVVTAAGSRVEAESEEESVEKLRARMASRECTVEKIGVPDGATEKTSMSDPAEGSAGWRDRFVVVRRWANAAHVALGRRGIILASLLLVVVAGALVWMCYGTAFLRALEKAPAPGKAPEVERSRSTRRSRGMRK